MTKETKGRFQRVLPLVLSLLVAGLAAQSWFLFQLSRELRAPAPESAQAPETPATQTKENSEEEQARAFSPPHSPRPTAPSPPLWDPDPWNPFEEMERMREQMDSLFGRMMGGMNRSQHFDPFPRATLARQPRMNVRESDEAYELSLEFPGATHAEINTEIRDGHLHVSAQVSQEKNQNGGGMGRLTHIERLESRFQRTIPLPPDVDADAMTTEYEDGMLRITLPKRAPAIHDTI